jgi:uncharacterized protein involved in exopolysaccharide biosynthesis
MEMNNSARSSKFYSVDGGGSTDGSSEPLGSSLLEFFSVITKWRRFIVWIVLAATIVSGVVAFLSPKWYKATASIFPAEQADLFSGLGGVSSLMKSISAGKKNKFPHRPD